MLYVPTWADGPHRRFEDEWPTWVLVEPHEITPYNRPEPCLFAVYEDGTEIGPYPVVLPQP